ncbi:MAG: hypothetical protein AVDCRST_MAG19-3003, partial [uncultured Thermomicrobiales bacterium]
DRVLGDAGSRWGRMGHAGTARSRRPAARGDRRRSATGPARQRRGGCPTGRGGRRGSGRVAPARSRRGRRRGGAGARRRRCRSGAAPPWLGAELAAGPQPQPGHREPVPVPEQPGTARRPQEEGKKAGRHRDHDRDQEPVAGEQDRKEVNPDRDGGLACEGAGRRPARVRGKGEPERGRRPQRRGAPRGGRLSSQPSARGERRGPAARRRGLPLPAPEPPSPRDRPPTRAARRPGRRSPTPDRRTPGRGRMLLAGRARRERGARAAVVRRAGAAGSGRRHRAPSTRPSRRAGRGRSPAPRSDTRPRARTPARPPL